MARSAIGSSPASEAEIVVPTMPVSPPSGLTASIADPFDGNVSLSWDAPTDRSAIVGYLVPHYLGADPYTGTDTPLTMSVEGSDDILSRAVPGDSIVVGYRVQHRMGEADPQTLSDGIT